MEEFKLEFLEEKLRKSIEDVDLVFLEEIKVEILEEIRRKLIKEKGVELFE